MSLLILNGPLYCLSSYLLMNATPTTISLRNYSLSLLSFYPLFILERGQAIWGKQEKINSPLLLGRVNERRNLFALNHLWVKQLSDWTCPFDWLNFYGFFLFYSVWKKKANPLFLYSIDGWSYTYVFFSCLVNSFNPEPLHYNPVSLLLSTEEDIWSVANPFFHSKLRKPKLKIN